MSYMIYLRMNCNDRVLVCIGNLDGGHPVTTHSDGLPCATSSTHVPGNDVTISSSGQAGLEVLVQWDVIIVDSNESLVPSAERYLVVVVVPPIGQRIFPHDVPKSHHVVDLPPPNQTIEVETKLGKIMAV